MTVPKQWVPFGYMQTALSFLLDNPKSGLFLDPGLGKTSISLACIKILKYNNKVKGVLVVAPLRVVYGVWPDEIKKWKNFNSLTCTILHENNKLSIWGEQKDIYLINPEGLKWLHNELLKGLKAGKQNPFNALWLDESTKYKSHESDRFKYIVNMIPLFPRRHIMTGTPSPKSLMDLWSQVYILDEGKTLGNNFYEFRKKYFESNDWNKHDWKIKDFSTEEIYKKVAPLVLEMSSENYTDMPPLIYNNIKIQLPAKALKYYKQMEKDMFIQLNDMEASAKAAAQLSMKCHQIANGNVYEDIPEHLDDDEIKEFKRTRKTIHIHKAKLEALQDLINELSGKPLLVAYWYKHDLKTIQEMLGNVPYIGSGITSKQANKIVDRWNKGLIPVLLGHPDSMGHGLNMQVAANDICWYSLTWNLELYIQFIKRVYRNGMKGNVRVHHLVAMLTTDQAMLLRLGERAEDQQDLRTALTQYRKGLK